MATTQPIRNKHQVRIFAQHYLKLGKIRNHVLVVFGLHTALRICDLLCLTWDDVYDFDNRRFRNSISITENKTRKSKTITLNKRAIAALGVYLSSAERGVFLFASRKGENAAISRQQAYRIIRAASDALGFACRVSCHSLRKTFGYHAWKADVPPMVIMKVFNHSNLAVTQRYLGITQDDIDDCYHKIASLM